MPSIHKPHESSTGNRRRLLTLLICLRDDVMGVCLAGMCIDAKDKAKTYLGYQGVGDAVGGAADKVKKAFDVNPEHTVPVHVSKGLPSQKPELSAQDKLILQHSWDYMKDDLYYICKDMYSRLLLDYPYVTRIFHKAAGYDLLISNESLATGHAQRIVFTVEKIINRLEYEPEKWISYIYAVGFRHGEISMRGEYFDLFVPYFVESMHRVANTRTAASLETTWVNFFSVITYYLKNANVF